ncbi:hypothetical protein [Paracidovorax sp. MALMAid1276]|uniref:hypothetical protein n=1 Tax=Paracidovorax sp. MALMAid1276 TaxID=3411631 RepID=UPI003B9C1D69
MNIRNTIIGAGLWVVATGASALTLGASRGAVVLGGPVDLTFEVQPDPGSDVASSCVDAALRAGDTPIGTAKVRITPVAQAGRPPAVRVQAAVAVDEPILTVTLTAGCAGKVSRTYTFLADFPVAVPRTAAPVDLARLAQAAQAAQGGAAGASAASAATVGPAASAPSPSALADGGTAASARSRQRQPTADAAAPPRSRARPATRAPEAAAARPAARPSAAAAPQAGARPRLVLEPLDVWLDSPVALRPSMELLITPSQEPTAQRAEAAAQWRALNAQPQDLQDPERLKALEAEAAALRSQASRDRDAAAQLQQQLAQAEEERFPAWVVYALAAVLLLVLLVVARLWTRLRTASDRAVAAWRDSVALGSREVQAAHDAAMGLSPHPGDAWDSADGVVELSEEKTGAGRAPAYEPFVSTSPTASGSAPLGAAQGAEAAPHLAPHLAVPSGSAPLADEPWMDAQGPVVAAPAPAAARGASGTQIVNPEALFDVQQQAEFFVSVGEHQQAIDVLRTHIAEHRESSPLAYLELLRLYHTLSRVDEFSQLREQFMASFNAQVPEFTGFHRTGRMLYHYTDALAEIEAEWTSPAVLMLLEKFLFRSIGGDAVEPFDLAAYDDLLLLLSIAQTTPASARGEPPPRKRTTPLAPPRADILVAEAPPGHRRKDDRPPESMAAGLDFDFDLVPADVARQQAEAAQATTAPAPLDPDSRSVPLDLDLSEPPEISFTELPPVPVTAAPPAGQAVGFGMDNDLMELRLELENQQQQQQRKKPS